MIIQLHIISHDISVSFSKYNFLIYNIGHKAFQRLYIRNGRYVEHYMYIKYIYKIYIYIYLQIMLSVDILIFSVTMS